MQTQEVRYDWKEIQDSLVEYDHYDERFLKDCFRKAGLEHLQNGNNDFTFKNEGEDFVMRGKEKEEVDRMVAFSYEVPFKISASKKEDAVVLKGTVIR